MRIAVVTGASAGMGREFARQLPDWENFDEIWLIARRTAALQALAAELPCPARVLGLDLTDTAARESYSALLAKEQPTVAVLVNAAGYGRFAACADIPLADMQSMIALNCGALVDMTQRTLPYMTKGSRVIQLGSLSAFQPVPYIAVYGASKAFVLSYSRALQREVRAAGIRVMTVDPGWVRTEFFSHANAIDDTAVTYYNILWEADAVVKTALHDAYRTKKEMSIHGLPVKLQVLAVKLLPHRLVMHIWLKQQKHL